MKASSFKQFLIEESTKYFRNGISEFECELEYRNLDSEGFPRMDTDLQSHAPEDAEDAATLNKLGLGKRAREVEYERINSVKLFYDMDADYGSTGLEGVTAKIKAVRISGYYEVWNDERDESETYDYEIEMDEATAATNVSLQYENTLPMEPTYAMVNFNDGIDPKNVKLTVTIGSPK